MSYKYQA